MIHRGWVCLLLGALAWGQAANPAPAATPNKPAVPAGVGVNPAPASAAPEAKPPEASKVAPDAPVITLEGLCDNPPADKEKAADCKTVVTRAEFEKVVDAVQPAMSPFARKQFATRYAMGLVMSHEAQKLGLDHGPKFEEQLKLLRMQVLNQALGQKLQEKASQIPDKDIEDYYQHNPEAYDEASLQKLFIPKTKQLAPTKEKLTAPETQKRQQAADATVKAEAEKLRGRAAAGEDFAKLQAEAFVAAGFKTKPPSTSLGKMRRTSLPPNHVAVMDVKSGGVSELITDQTGYIVYKVGEKDRLPLDKVREEIHGVLQAQRMQDSTRALQQSVTPTLDENYFVLPAGAVPPPQGITLPGGGARPPAKPAAQPPSSGPK